MPGGPQRYRVGGFQSVRPSARLSPESCARRAGLARKSFQSGGWPRRARATLRRRAAAGAMVRTRRQAPRASGCNSSSSRAPGSRARWESNRPCSSATPAAMPSSSRHFATFGQLFATAAHSGPAGLSERRWRSRPKAFRASPRAMRSRPRSRVTDSAGSAAPLPSERDQNFLIADPRRGKFVLKIANREDSAELLDFQHEAMRRVAARGCGIKVPRLVPSLAGEDVETLTSRDGSGAPAARAHLDRGHGARRAHAARRGAARIDRRLDGAGGSGAG